MIKDNYMIGAFIKIEVPTENIINGKKIIAVKVLDRIRTASLVADNNGNGLSVQQDCYLCSDSTNKCYLVAPIQIKEIDLNSLTTII